MKTFLSIGSGPGMGMATASRFAGEGFRVVLSSRNKSNVAAQADQLRAAGFAAEGRVADASDITSIVDLIREVEVETGGVDVLHFNAAAMHDGNLETQSVAGFIQDLTTNIGAVYAAIKAVSPRMAARGEGAILLTGGMFATQPHPEYLTLSVGKAGLLNLTHGLFPVLKAQNIHLSIVTVGPTSRRVPPKPGRLPNCSGGNIASHQRNGQRKRFIPPHTISNLPRPSPGVRDLSPGRAEKTSSIACFPCHLGSGYLDIHGGYVMKYFIGMTVTLLLSTPVLAAGELEINQSPLTLVLSDQNQARVSSCADFIALRKAGETVDALPGLSDPDGRAAEAALFSCWLQAYTIDHTLFPSAGPKPTLADVVQHFPASAAFIVSDDEKQDVAKNYVGKTIADYTPDLKARDDRLESAASTSGYVLDEYYAFTDKQGHQLNIVALVGYAIGGTASVKSYYRIDDTHARVWSVTLLDENSPL